MLLHYGIGIGEQQHSYLLDETIDQMEFSDVCNTAVAIAALNKLKPKVSVQKLDQKTLLYNGQLQNNGHFHIIGILQEHDDYY